MPITVVMATTLTVVTTSMPIIYDTYQAFQESQVDSLEVNTLRSLIFCFMIHYLLLCLYFGTNVDPHVKFYENYF